MHKRSKRKISKLTGSMKIQQRKKHYSRSSKMCLLKFLVRMLVRHRKHSSLNNLHVQQHNLLHQVFLRVHRSSRALQLVMDKRHQVSSLRRLKIQIRINRLSAKANQMCHSSISKPMKNLAAMLVQAKLLSLRMLKDRTKPISRTQDLRVNNTTSNISNTNSTIRTNNNSNSNGRISNISTTSTSSTSNISNSSHHKEVHQIKDRASKLTLLTSNSDHSITNSSSQTAKACSSMAKANTIKTCKATLNTLVSRSTITSRTKTRT